MKGHAPSIEPFTETCIGRLHCCSNHEWNPSEWNPLFNMNNHFAKLRIESFIQQESLFWQPEVGILDHSLLDSYVAPLTLNKLLNQYLPLRKWTFEIKKVIDRNGLTSIYHYHRHLVISGYPGIRWNNSWGQNSWCWPMGYSESSRLPTKIVLVPHNAPRCMSQDLETCMLEFWGKGSKIISTSRIS